MVEHMSRVIGELAPVMGALVGYLLGRLSGRWRP